MYSVQKLKSFWKKTIFLYVSKGNRGNQKTVKLCTIFFFYFLHEKLHTQI
jgi:hypothetical protein